MALAVDISILGDKELERKLSILPDRIQKKVVRQAVTKAAKRAHKRLIDNLSGKIVRVRTGRLLGAVKAGRPKADKSSPRELIKRGTPMPTRSELEIGSEPGGLMHAIAVAKGRSDPTVDDYYPAFVEYGDPKRGVSAKKPFRRSIDDYRDQEIKIIGTDIGSGIEREAAKA